MRQGATILTICFLLLSPNIFGQASPTHESDLHYPESLNVFFFQKENPHQINHIIKSHKRFRKLINQLRNERERRDNEHDFLRSIFNKVHNKHLRFYDKYAVMHETLGTGSYGCVTGTALYATILSAFDFDFDIIELPNHVFIQVTGEEGYYIFESTLPLTGFRRLKHSIMANSQHLDGDYRKIMSQQIVGNESTVKDSINLPYRTICLTELAGLQQFNEAVRFYKAENFKESINHATKAYNLYPSKRNQELMQLIVNKIIKHELLTGELKDQYLNHYVSLVKKNKLSQTK